MTALFVDKPGLLATVQDLGRPGWGRLGISSSGAMDPLALRAANRLAGNEEGAPALELLGPGARLRFDAPALVALGGADLGALVDGEPLLPWQARPVPAGARLTFTARRWGARAVLAVAGGFVSPRFLGSAATDLGAALGGPGGGALHAGDRLDIGPLQGPPGRVGQVAQAYALPSVLHFVADQTDLPPATQELLAARPWRLEPRSNRTGLRFGGEALSVPAAADARSEPVAPRTIQVPPDGRPILLLADRGTVGGYARAGAVIRADQPKAAQLWIGDEVRFVPIEPALARALLLAQERLLYDDAEV